MAGPNSVKKGSRLQGRVAVILSALSNSLKSRQKPHSPQRILIAHQLLLGDTLMLTPLLAKLRQKYLAAEIVMISPQASSTLYQSKPYGVEVLPFDLRDTESFKELKKRAGFDLAIVPGDNRYSWLARALDSRWIVAFSRDRPAYKSWPVNELVDYSNTPRHWSDMVAAMIEGADTQTYSPEQWPAPTYQPFDEPSDKYCILHIGASSRLKLWPPERWLTLARKLTEQGLQVVWSGGPGEQKIVDEIDPDKKCPSYAGKLDLPQLWHLLTKAELLVCPDTGIAHLGRLVNTPTVTLFGPGSPTLHGAGEFWRNSPYIALSNEIECRDQPLLYKREISWVKRCARTSNECKEPRCMLSITVDQVWQATEQLLNDNPQ